MQLSIVNYQLSIVNLATLLPYVGETGMRRCGYVRYN